LQTHDRPKFRALERCAAAAVAAVFVFLTMPSARAAKPSLVGDVRIYAVDWSPTAPATQTPIKLLDAKGLIGTKLWAAWSQIASPPADPLCVALKNSLSQPNLIAKGVNLEVLGCKFNTIAPDMEFLPGPIGSAASVSSSTAHVTFSVPGNTLQAVFTQPTAAGNYADPCFSVNLDIVVSAQIDFRSFTVTKMPLTGQNASSPTGCNPAGTLAQILMADYHHYLGGPNFLAKAQAALDTTQEFSTKALNDAVQSIAGQVQSNAQQYVSETILIEPNKIGIALAPIYTPSASGAIAGMVHWKGTGAAACSPLPIAGRVQTGPQPMNPLTLQFFGAAPFATVGRNSSSGNSTRGRDGSYECPYAETGLPSGVPVTFGPVNACGGGATQALAHGVTIKPLGWSGTVNPSSSGLDFEADALTCGSSVGALAKSALAFNLALLPHGPDSMISQGEAAYQRGDYAAAAKAFQQAFNANPKSYVALHDLALANAKLGNVSQAKTELSQAMSLAQAARDASAVKAIGASLGALGG